MRRGWLALALLCALVGLSAWHAATLGGLTGEVGGLLAQAEAQAEAGNWDGADALTHQARQRWEERDFYLHATMEHTVTDAVDMGFAETLELIQCREAGEYSAANARLMRQLQLMGEMELPLPGNLL